MLTGSQRGTGAGRPSRHPRQADPRGGWTGPAGQGEPAVPGEPTGAGGLLAPLARRSWLSAIVGAVALAVITGGVTALVWRPGTPARQVAADCGLVNCGAALPSPVTIISTQSRVTTAPKKAHKKVHKPAVHTPAPSASPSQAPAPAPPPPPDVTVTFDPGGDQHFGHFQAQLSIVNHGSSPVSGWTVQLTLPRAEVDFVGSQDGWSGTPFEHWQFSGDTLTLSADTRNETLAPGAREDVTIHGRGHTTFLTGCTFNGTACQS